MKNDSLKKIITFISLPIILIFLEMTLHFGTGFKISDMKLPEMIAVSAALSGTVLLICVLTRSDTASGWIIFIFTELITVVYIISFFTYDAYKVFMTPSMIVLEAGDVATGFTDTVLNVIVKGFGWIVLFQIPAILCLIGAVRKFFRIGVGSIISLLIHIVVIILVTLGCFSFAYYSNSKSDTYDLSYDYTEAVKKFGLVQAVILDTEKELARNNSCESQMFIESASNETVENTLDAEIPDANSTDVKTPAEEKTEIEYGYNTLDINFAELAEDHSKNGWVRIISEYVASLTPTKKNEYTGLLKGKNLILITAESLTKEVVDKERTPTLYRLANSGIVFEDFYQPAWGGSTSTGEFAFITGLIPVSATSSGESMQKNMYFTMGNQLQREGYFSMAFHNGDYDYYARNYTHPNFGYGRFLAKGDMLPVTKGFPASDEDMMENTVDMYIENEPFSIYYMTISGHCNYGFDPGVNAMSRKNEEVVKDMPYGEKVRAYYACNQELEYALEYLIKRLEEKGVLDNTVIALVSDHYPYGLTRSVTWDSTEDALSELYGYEADTDRKRDHSIGFIWSTDLEKMGPIVVKDPAYTIDMVPTLSNLFGLDFDSRLLAGRDVFSDATPLVMWKNGHWLTDKGYYDGEVFTPENPSDTADYKEYIEMIKAEVTKKRNFSENVLEANYYYLLFGKDECTGRDIWREEYNKYEYH